MTNIVINRGNQAIAQCAFTFDEGSLRKPIDAWLEALEQGGARGTFFLTGEWYGSVPGKSKRNAGERP